MPKHVHSKDPMKERIVRALRAGSGGSRVSLVEEIGPKIYRGHCMKKSAGKGFDTLGFWIADFNTGIAPTVRFERHIGEPDPIRNRKVGT